MLCQSERVSTCVLERDQGDQEVKMESGNGFSEHYLLKFHLEKSLSLFNCTSLDTSSVLPRQTCSNLRL